LKKRLHLWGGETGPWERIVNQHFPCWKSNVLAEKGTACKENLPTEFHPPRKLWCRNWGRREIALPKGTSSSGSACEKAGEKPCESLTPSWKRSCRLVGRVGTKSKTFLGSGEGKKEG